MLRYLNAYRNRFFYYFGKLKRVLGNLKTKDLCIMYSDSIGEYTYGFPEIFPFEGRTISIGKFCSFANDVKIFLGHEHNIEWMSSYPFDHFGDFSTKISAYGYSKGDVNIGNDVWVGYGATILSGVTIGNGAVIAAGSMVTKDVEPYSIVGGVPAKLIKYRFNQTTIKKLEKLCWWDWSQEKIQENLDWMCKKDFMNHLDKVK